MSSPRLVIGNGPDALRAAAVLASAGQRVLLLQEGPTPSGLLHPDLPVGTGGLHVDPDVRELTEELLGALVEAPDLQRGVLARGRVRRLPMSPSDIPGLFAPAQRPAAARSWLRRRARLASRRFVGGGQEERSHRDWVVRRMGEVAWHHLYRDYAQRRWGAPSAQLSPAVARQAHGTPDTLAQQAVGGGWAQGLAQAEQAVLSAGGTIRTGAVVKRLIVTYGKVSGVVADGRRNKVQGPVWVAASPHRVAAWLGKDLPAAAKVDVQHLRALPAVRVALKGSVDGLPDDLHVLDEGALFWRVVAPYGVERTAIFHITGDADPDDAALASAVAAAAQDLGVGGFSAQDARIERIPGWNPVWLETVHARMRRLLQVWRALGLVGVGRAGTMSPLDPGEELMLAARYRDADDPDQLAVHRELLMPSPWEPDLNAHITRFIER